MKKILTAFIFLLPVMVFAKVHYAKVEPYERSTVKSSVSGTVLKADLSAEGNELGDEAFVQIDDSLDRENLKNTEESIKLFEENLKINEEMLTGLKSTLDRREEYFERLNELDTASKTQKDNAFAAYIGAKNQYLGTKEKIITLKKQIIDMKYKAAMLRDTIAKKHIAAPGKYLYKLMVANGEFVAPGVPIAVVDDIFRSKIELFVDSDEVQGLDEKNIYINDEPTDYTIDKIWKIADSRYISSYRVRIVLPPKYPFSKLLKIEFK